MQCSKPMQNHTFTLTHKNKQTERAGDQNVNKRFKHNLIEQDNPEH